MSYRTSTDVDTILLDVLTEENNYHAVESLPIRSPFLLTEGPDVVLTKSQRVAHHVDDPNVGQHFAQSR